MSWSETGRNGRVEAADTFVDFRRSEKTRPVQVASHASRASSEAARRRQPLLAPVPRPEALPRRDAPIWCVARRGAGMARRLSPMNPTTSTRRATSASWHTRCSWSYESRAALVMTPADRDFNRNAHTDDHGEDEHDPCGPTPGARRRAVRRGSRISNEAERTLRGPRVARCRRRHRFGCTALSTLYPPWSVAAGTAAP